MSMEHVSPDDPFVPLAETWNGFLDASAWVKENGNRIAGNTTGANSPNQIVLVKNTGAELIREFTPVFLESIAIEAEKNLSQFKYSQSVFNGRTATDESADIACALEPIAAGRTGKALLYGIVSAQVDCSNAADAVKVEGGKWKAASDGPVKLVYKSATGDGALRWCKIALGLGGCAAIPASPICAIVTSGNDLIGYSVQLYPNGYDQPGIGVGTAFLLQGNPQLQTIPIGTKIMVYPYGGMLETLG